MIRIPLPGEDNVLLLTPRWDNLWPPVQALLLGTLLLVPLALALWLYRRELRLVHGRAAGLLLGLRILLLAALWLVVGWQPVLVHEVAEHVPGRVIVAVDESRSMDVTDPQRTILEKLRLAQTLKITAGAGDRLLEQWIAHFEQENPKPLDSRELNDLLREMDALTRGETARRILTPDGLDLLRRLAEQHKVERIGFAKSLGTDLGQPLLEALEKSGTADGTLRGAVLLTDGRHNRGASPLTAAVELGARQIPIYPIALGASVSPPDVAVLDVSAPHDVFKDVEIPVQARIKLSGLPPQEIRVELHEADKRSDPKNVRTVQHDGKDRVYELLFEPSLGEAGVHRLEVKAAPADPQTREVTRENNVAAVTVRVSDDKIKVLLVDGEARWEYQYLANALARDKTLELDRVVFIQPRVGQIPDDKLEKLGHPRLRLPELKDERDDPLAKYHCIVLGDVPPEHLSLAERRRLERYVSERGGSLIVVAGKRAMPLAFLEQSADDPLIKLLPISEPRVLKPEAGFAIRLTPDGARTSFMQLDSTPPTSAERWGGLPKHFWSVVGQVKPGAEPLAFVAEEKEPAPDAGKVSLERRQGLIVKQQYGFGRVLFVGLDSTWRWRYRVGDKHHHRFWTQAIRWAAADQLLPAGNGQVRYGARKPIYHENDEIEIVVRLGDDVPPLRQGAIARARLVPLERGEAAVVSLHARENQPRLLEGKIKSSTTGSYRIEVDIPDIKDRVKDNSGNDLRRDQFTVVPAPDVEMLDLATDWPLLESLAASTQGEVFTPESVQRLLDRLTRQMNQRHRREESRLWQDAPGVWWLLGSLLILLTAEWIAKGGRVALSQARGGAGRSDGVKPWAATRPDFAKQEGDFAKQNVAKWRTRPTP